MQEIHEAHSIRLGFALMAAHAQLRAGGQ